MSAKLQVKHRGPLVVEGDFELRDADGAPLALPGPKVALCRCGASARKPFCDGSHNRVGFGADEPKREEP
ncbi:MAG: CDGSH iron-sulfur domain-containing protein [Archangium sp.]|nr:CDGSH iron-sulfur domain-containing protein [Archangium sp.]